MDTYTAVKNRIMILYEQKHMSIRKRIHEHFVVADGKCAQFFDKVVALS